MGFGVNTVEGTDLANTSGHRPPPGWYHAVISEVKDGLSSNGQPINGFTVMADILAGKPDTGDGSDLNGKSVHLTFWAPDMSKPAEDQERTNRLNTAFMLAVDLVSPAQLGKSIEVEPPQAVGRHLVVHLRNKQKKETVNGKDTWVDDPRYLQIAFNDVYHIDDPDGASCPKNVASLKFIPQTLRHGADYFAFKKKASASTAAASKEVDI